MDGGYAHLGGNLHNAVEHSQIIVADSRVIVLIQHAGGNQGTNGLVGQIWVDGTGPVPQQGGKMVDLPGLTAFQYQSHAGAFLGPHQVLLQGRHSQQGRNGHMVLIYIPV